MKARSLAIRVVAAVLIVVVVAIGGMIVRFTIDFEPPDALEREWTVDGKQIRELRLDLPGGSWNCEWLVDGKRLAFMSSERAPCEANGPPEKRGNDVVIATQLGFVVIRDGKARTVNVERWTVDNTMLFGTDLGLDIERDVWRVRVGGDAMFESTDAGATWLPLSPRANKDR